MFQYNLIKSYYYVIQKLENMTFILDQYIFFSQAKQSNSQVRTKNEKFYVKKNIQNIRNCLNYEGIWQKIIQFIFFFIQNILILSFILISNQIFFIKACLIEKYKAPSSKKQFFWYIYLDSQLTDYTLDKEYKYNCQLGNILFHFSTINRWLLFFNSIENKQEGMAYSNALNFIVFLILFKISLTLDEYLGPNLLLNSDFQQPQISPPILGWTEQFNNGIIGWNCTSKCHLGKLSSACFLNIGSLCSLSSSGQLINLQSSSGNQQVSQIFQISTIGQYQLSFSWLPPQSSNINSKYVDILLGGSVIDSITINRSNYQLTTFSVYTIRVNLTSQSNQFRLAMKGTQDGMGILVDNAFLQQIIYNQSTSSNSTQSNSTSNNSQSTNSSNNQSSIYNNSNQTSSNNNSNQISNNQSSSNNTNSNQSSNLNNNNQSSSNNDTNQTSNNNNNQTINNQTYNITTTQNQTIYQSQLLVYSDILFQNQLIKSSNGIPGGRVYLKIILDFFPNFDRLQFYYFHKQNFTFYAQYFLQAIQRLKQGQGQMLSNIIKTSNQIGSMKKGEQFILSHNYKEKYQNSFYLTRNSDGINFLTNQVNYFYYDLSVILLIFAMCYLIFKLTFSCKISQNFRKYCFLGLILVIIFEGNMEQFTFFYFLQVKQYFSKNFAHKIVNILIMLFGFLTVLFSFGMSLIFKWYYQQMGKYFIENLRFTFYSFLFVTLQNGIIPFISGVIHAYYFEKLLNVTISLILMQLLWIIARIYLFSFKIFEERYKVIINIINSFLRILFLVTLYLYHKGHKIDLMNQIHLYFMISYLSLWAIQTIITFYYIGKELFYFIYRPIKKICPSNKIEAINQKIIQNSDIISRNNSWRQRLAHVKTAKKYVLSVPKVYENRKSIFSTDKAKRKVLVRESIFKNIKIQDFF